MIVKHIHNHPGVMTKLLAVQAALTLTKYGMRIGIAIDKAVQQNSPLHAWAKFFVVPSFYRIGHKITQLYFGIIPRQIYVC